MNLAFGVENRTCIGSI